MCVCKIAGLAEEKQIKCNFPGAIALEHSFGVGRMYMSWYEPNEMTVKPYKYMYNMRYMSIVLHWGRHRARSVCGQDIHDTLFHSSAY